MSNPNFKYLAVWIYCGEYIATSFIYGFFFLIYDPGDISLFMIKTSEHIFSKFTYLMLTVSIAFYWNFYKQSDSDFAKWLYRKNSYNTYANVFLSTIAVYFLTLVALTITEISKNNIVAYLAGWLVVLALFNIFTLFKNINDIMKLNTYFQIKLEEETKH